MDSSASANRETASQRRCRLRRLVLAVTLFAAGVGGAVLLAGCGSSKHPAAAFRSTGRQQAVEIMRQLSRCIRDHGVADFPDPTVGSDGTPSLPASAPRVPATARTACAAIANRVPAQFTSTQPVSTSDFQRLLQFARCVRAHGVPDWPDPNPLGEFPLNSRIQAATKRLVAGSTHVCARLNPDPSDGIKVVSAP